MALRVCQSAHSSGGIFGENLTTSGFDEDSICIGDRFSIGTAVFTVTQPRVPGSELGIRLGDQSLVERVYKSGKWGYYLAVMQEGEIETGDDIRLEGRDGNDVKLSDVARCLIDPDVEKSLIDKVLKSNLAAQMKTFLARLYRTLTRAPVVWSDGQSQNSTKRWDEP